MAKIIPDGWRGLAVTGGAKREIETLALLAREPPESYYVYRAMRWANVGVGAWVFDPRRDRLRGRQPGRRFAVD